MSFTGLCIETCAVLRVHPSSRSGYALVRVGRLLSICNPLCNLLLRVAKVDGPSPSLNFLIWSKFCPSV